eukprot:TRINITY_DN56514_c0_g1_i1.p1 TRINITY_DN56514_c0_g1~~TRINITY_DN56514_c0_g1_i1.p1  ORF type:complete len:783 (-),score=135.83 TRINITY_DN56514_c0_g1_i1:20-2368(-)
MGGERWSKLGCDAGDPHAMPWLVPVSQKLELIFFQKVFNRLRQSVDLPQDEKSGVPVLVFRRAMSRLLRLLQDDRNFEASQYDIDQDGTVGWWEFCILWKEERLAVNLSTAERIYLTLEDPQASRVGRITSIFVLMAIFLSAGSFIISTMPSMQRLPCPTCEPVPTEEFEYIDVVCVILFTIEYCLRLLTASFMRMELMNQDELIRMICTDEILVWPTKARRTWDFVRAWPNVIDLASILPSYIAWIVAANAEETVNGSSGGTAIFFRLLRLMRVVRAFRLGRRFEAVIIIARSMQRSVRALWVLVLNLSLGMIIFGAVMYFMEQGIYNPETGLYERFERWELDSSTNRYVEVKGPSPFESIPHSFWWALVTATTTGYGDHSPTTVQGKITAAIAMVWSICVIALPVGVIGANFENVWKEYDNEKKIERKFKESEEQMVKATLGSIDPITYSRQMILEVYHDSQMPTKENNLFVGEAEMILDIDETSSRQVKRHVILYLRENREKSNRKVSGQLHVSYTWSPHKSADPDVILEGELRVVLERAENLSLVDWKGSGLCDPYVVLTLFPKSPAPEDGNIVPTVEQFRTIVDEVQPRWNETKCFKFLWRKDGVLAKKAVDKRRIREAHHKVSPELEERNLVESLPRLSNEVSDLHRILPDLQSEVRELRKGTLAILSHLGIPVQGCCVDDADAAEARQCGGVNEQQTPGCWALPPAPTPPAPPAPLPPTQFRGLAAGAAETRSANNRGSQDVACSFVALVPGAVPEGTSMNTQVGVAASRPQSVR